MTFTVDVKLEVPMERVISNLTNWIELGGDDDDWASITKAVYPEGTKKEDFLPGGKFNPHKDYRAENPLALVATTPGGSLIVNVIEDADSDRLDKEYSLNLDTIKRGLQVMATLYPTKHFPDLHREGGGDIITSSVFVQCCLFEKIIYG